MENQYYKGYYSIVRYVHNLERGEHVNIGVLVYCPELGFLNTMLSPGQDKPKRYFSSEEGWDADKFREIRTIFKQRIENEHNNIASIEDLQQFVDTRANQIILSPPRGLKIVNPNHQLEDLYKKLVGGRSPRVLKGESAMTTTKIRNTLLREIEDMKMADKIRKSITINGIIRDMKYEYPVVFGNGVMNFVKPVCFNQETIKQAEKDADHIIVEALDVQRTCEQHMKYKGRIIAVASFRPSIMKAKTKLSAIFSQFSPVMFVEHENFEPLRAEIRKAHDSGFVDEKLEMLKMAEKS